MATVSEIDGKLDELKRQAAALKEQRKIAAAKEREQARKWKAATLAAIGEIVLKTLGADWTAIDLNELQPCNGAMRTSPSSLESRSVRRPTPSSHWRKSAWSAGTCAPLT